jgi:hypothetical protein
MQWKSFHYVIFKTNMLSEFQNFIDIEKPLT